MPNTVRFAGEQFNPDPNLSYDRATFLNVATGGCCTMVSLEVDRKSSCRSSLPLRWGESR
jgi:hypothetical protein